MVTFMIYLLVMCEQIAIMVGWFANAMMAMHDYLKSQPASDAVQVPRELLERAAYMMEVCELDGPTMRELRALLNGGRV